MIDEGRNDRYRIENDKTDAERIPVLAPTPRPPVGILKADKRRVLAGITNKYLAEATGDHNGTTCVLIGSHQGIDGQRAEVKVRVTYHTSSADQGDVRNSGTGELVVTDMSLGAAPTINNDLKVVKMELLNLLEAPDDMNSPSSVTKLFPGEKLMLCVHDGSNQYQDDTPSIVGEVSLGSPIVTFEDPLHLSLIHI